jgi:hypothetical protein
MADETVAQFKPWRDVYAVHPDCERLPPAMPGEVAALASDIGRHGLLVPVEFWVEPGQDEVDAALLDGRNRLDALQQAGYRFAIGSDGERLMRDRVGVASPLPCRYLRGDEVPYPLERVVSLNAVRRHWTTAQKRTVIAELLKDMPDYSNRQIAQLVGVDGKTVGTVRAHLEALGELFNLDATQGQDGRWRTTKPRHAKPPAENAPPSVKVETERLARLQTARARDSGDLFVWERDGPEKIARVFVEDGAARSSLGKVSLVLNAAQREVKRLTPPPGEKGGLAPASQATKPAKPPRKLSDIPEEQQAAIREAWTAGKSSRDIAAEHGLFQDQVRTICKNA